MVFPGRKGLTEQQISNALASLANAGMITLYDVDGESYLCFPNWEAHRQIRNQKSKFPGPDSKGTRLKKSDIGGKQKNTADNSCDQLQSIDINGYQMKSVAPVIQSNPNPESDSESGILIRIRIQQRCRDNGGEGWIRRFLHG